MVVLCLGCRGADDLGRAAAMLVVPAGGRVEGPAEKAKRFERIATTVCYAGRDAAELGRELEAGLRVAGWEAVVVERHPAIAGRWSVRGSHDGLGLAGVIEDGADGCAGVRVSIGAHVLPDSVGRRSAGAPRLKGHLPPAGF